VKSTITIPDVLPEEIEMTVQLLRALTYNIRSWYWVQGNLYLRIETPRFKVKMRFKSVVNYHQVFKYTRRFR
jgi:hypothetical protein